jgi:hypothetical protein
MKALYLYFTGTATQGRGSSAPTGDGRPAGVRPTLDEGPLVPIQPGAFSRWMANRDRVVSENAAALRRPLDARRCHGARTGKATG